MICMIQLIIFQFIALGANTWIIQITRKTIKHIANVFNLFKENIYKYTLLSSK